MRIRTTTGWKWQTTGGKVFICIASRTYAFLLEIGPFSVGWGRNRTKMK